VDYRVIYVTGAPASGKSSTLARLHAMLPQVGVWEYGAKLTEFLKARGADIADQRELRSRSAGVVTPADINALDNLLQEWVEERRDSQHLLIDSHPVTKEQYGFRATAFSLDRIKSLGLSEIWLFYCPPEITVERIRRGPAGRPEIALEEARMHTFAQASVAVTYGVAAGCPVYMFDTNVDQTELVIRLRGRLA
jgi:adenylate kinase